MLENNNTRAGSDLKMNKKFQQLPMMLQKSNCN